MKIAILGAGNLGGTLGQSWASCGQRRSDCARDALAGNRSGYPRGRPWIAEQGRYRLHESSKGRPEWARDRDPRFRGEQVARWAVGASVFKAMNQTGAENIRMAAFKGGKPVMFVCGDDETRKPGRAGAGPTIGIRDHRRGRTGGGAYVGEPYALLRIHLALVRKLGRDFAFGI